MTNRLTIPGLILVFLMVGCAKRSAITQASSAPAPLGAVRPVASAPPPAKRSGIAPARSSGPTSATRPTVRDFRPSSELKDIHFDFDKYEIRPEDAKILDANAEWLKANAQHLVLIEGHCDERGTEDYNLALGERRAKATMNYLVAQGVRGSRLTIISYGEERAVCTAHDETCWVQNRRAHLLVKAQ
jgi:peptidoglycan-associated lipoprotein